MRLKYIGPHDAVELDLPDAQSVRVARGEVVTVPDEYGERLREQESNWQFVSHMGAPSADEGLKGIRPHDLVRRSIARRRGQLGWTQRALADTLEAMGHPFPQTRVARLEVGRRSISVDDLVALASALNTSPLSLLAGAFDPGDELVAPTTRQVVSRERYRRWLRGSGPLPKVVAWESNSGETWSSSYRRAVTDEAWIEMQRTSLRLATAALDDILEAIEGVLDQIPGAERDAIAAAVGRFDRRRKELERSDREYPSERSVMKERRGRPRRSPSFVPGT